jgi:hypothetical protein
MANSTFSGPVRSQNGFQELVNGVYVPVGGGGEVLIVPGGGDETYTLNFTEVGQVITVVAQGAPGAEAGNITLAATAPGNPVIFAVDGTLINSRTTELGGFNTSFPHSFSFLYGGTMFLQVVYTGTFETFYGLTAYFKISGEAPIA